MTKYPTEALTGLTPADLVWMAGQWKGQHGQDIIEEHWSGFDAGTLMGMFR